MRPLHCQSCGWARPDESDATRCGVCDAKLVYPCEPSHALLAVGGLKFFRANTKSRGKLGDELALGNCLCCASTLSYPLAPPTRDVVMDDLATAREILILLSARTSDPTHGLFVLTTVHGVLGLSEGFTPEKLCELFENAVTTMPVAEILDEWHRMTEAEERPRKTKVRTRSPRRVSPK